MTKKLLIILLIVVIAGGVVIGGIFTWRYWQTLKQEVESAEEEESEVEVPANWKTYSNPGVNFTFKYHLDWEIKEEYQYKSAACQMDPECRGARYIFLNKIDDPRPVKMGEKEKFGIVINMPQCTGVKWSELPGDNWVCVFDEDLGVLNIYEQIKISFKLIEDETADWKTYRNEEYGFEVKYPKEWEVSEKPLPVYPDDFTIALTFTSPSGQDKIFFNVRSKNDEGMIREALAIISEEKIIVGGIEGVKITGAGQKEGSPRETSVLVTKGIYLYYFWFLQPFQKEIIFNQMLNTFKFIK